ncbi:hypothetical protein QLX08_005781 [Tetragonisca angustula]|uniref:Uncharacterized protein n=1 Tax=Tetragonisca angustula TaxID=166442 RepID=A0AAW0ZW95_9HYME
MQFLHLAEASDPRRVSSSRLKATVQAESVWLAVRFGFGQRVHRSEPKRPTYASAHALGVPVGRVEERHFPTASGTTNTAGVKITGRTWSVRPVAGVINIAACTDKNASYATKKRH